MNQVLVFLGLFFFSFNVQGQVMKNTESQTSDLNIIEDAPVLRHIVLFKFKESSTSEDIQSVEKAFANLPELIEEIHNFEWGINNSPESLNKDFTHSFVVTFTSENDRDRYLPHPAHQEFVEILKPHLEDVLVIDYWTK